MRLRKFSVIWTRCWNARVDCVCARNSNIERDLFFRNVPSVLFLNSVVLFFFIEWSDGIFLRRGRVLKKVSKYVFVILFILLFDLQNGKKQIIYMTEH